MKKILLEWQIVTFISLTLFALIYVLPNFIPNSPRWLPGNKIHLGLDLKGGSHFLLSLDFNGYMDDITQSLTDRYRQYLRHEQISYKTLQSSRNKIEIIIRNSSDYTKIKQVIHNLDSELSHKKEGEKITIFYDKYAITQIQDKLIEQSIEIIRMRIDSIGTKDPTIQRHGLTNILLQVPGDKNPDELKRVLGKTAKLTLHLVDENANLNDARLGKVPTGSQVIRFEEINDVLVIKKQAIISGHQLKNVQVQFYNEKPVVHFILNNVGAKKFADVTTNNQNKRLAIVLDNKVLTTPRINEPIIGGDGVISGNFTVKQAAELALMLRAGALPASLEVVEERLVGPNLGADSIQDGKVAAVAGFIFVVLFIILSYGILGFFANISLMISLLYILALLSLFQSTLTLPGIAGVILTIGMSVDANVLIYERIREEIDRGYSNLHAVKIGFESASSTITDSNFTTLIAAFLLYVFGIGGIKGFAITLTIGIVTSMYTSLGVTKLMINLWLKHCKPRSLGL